MPNSKKAKYPILSYPKSSDFEEPVMSPEVLR